MNNPEEINIFKSDLMKVRDKTNRLENFLLVCDHINLVYVLSGRGSALKQPVDHAEAADPEDDYERMYMGVLIANEIYRRTRVRVPIYYNGRKLHNKHLREALDRGIFDYPKECFIIEEINLNNTIGQAIKFQEFLSRNPEFSTIAMVSSAYHLPRVARTFGRDSPTISNHDETKENPIENANLVLFGLDRSFMRPGILKDLCGEIEAMDRYSSGENPTIARYQPTNTFLNQTDVLFYYSLSLQKKQKILNRKPALLESEEEPISKRPRASV